jgi:hypothetical protein
MEAKAKEGWRFRYVIIAAIISGAIFELGLLGLSVAGFSEGSTQVLDDALHGLRALTPWSLAIGYWEYLGNPPAWLAHPTGIEAIYVPLALLVAFPFHLMWTEPWPAALIDVIQLAVGVFCALILHVILHFKIGPSTSVGKFVFKLLLFPVTTLFFTTIFSLVVLVLIAGVAYLISFIVPPQHAIAITYGGLFGSVVAFISNKSAEAGLHEWITRLMSRWL